MQAIDAQASRTLPDPKKLRMIFSLSNRVAFSLLEVRPKHMQKILPSALSGYCILRKSFNELRHLPAR
jgi:hypothetical protein